MEAFLLRGREILGQHNLSVDTTPGKSVLYRSKADWVLFIINISPLKRENRFEQHLVVAMSDAQDLQMQAGIFLLFSPLCTPSLGNTGT